MISATPRPPSARRPVSARLKSSTYRASSTKADYLGRTATPRHQLERDDIIGPAQTHRNAVRGLGFVSQQLVPGEGVAPPARQMAGCIDDAEAEGTNVKSEIAAFEAKKFRCLVPTLVPPGMRKLKNEQVVAPRTIAGMKRRGSDTASITSLQKEKLRRDELFDALRVRWHAKDDAEENGAPSEVHNGIRTVDGVHYNSYQKPLDLGTSKMMRWLLDLKELRQSDLVKALRQHYKVTQIVPELAKEVQLLPPDMSLISEEEHLRRRKQSQNNNQSPQRQHQHQRPVPSNRKKKPQGQAEEVSLYLHRDPAIQTLREIWLRYCKNSKTLTMPNATVAFVNFLQDALPSSYFVEKKQAETMYRQLNDHRTQPLEYQLAFMKLILVLTDLDQCDAVALGHYMSLFFSSAYTVWNLDTDFAQTVDFQVIVSTFEDLTIGCLSAGSASGTSFGDTTTCGGGGGQSPPVRRVDARSVKCNSAAYRSPHYATLKGLIECLKQDIMVGYAGKRNPRAYIHVGPALDLFRDSTFVQLLRKRSPVLKSDGHFESVIHTQTQGDDKDILALAEVLLPRNPIPTLAAEDERSEFVKAPQVKLSLLKKMLGHEESNWEYEMQTAPYYKKLQRNTRSFHTWINDVFAAEAKHILFRLRPPAAKSDIPGLKQEKKKDCRHDV